MVVWHDETDTAVLVLAIAVVVVLSLLILRSLSRDETRRKTMR